MYLTRISSIFNTLKQVLFNPINIYFDIFLPHSIYCFYNSTFLRLTFKIYFIFTEEETESNRAALESNLKSVRERLEIERQSVLEYKTKLSASNNETTKEQKLNQTATQEINTLTVRKKIVKV